MDDNQCDFSTDELITKDTDFSGLEEFYCKYQSYHVISSGSTHSTSFRSYGGDAMPLSSAVTVLADKTSFLTRILPTITDVNFHTGSPAGGQLITITGRGWSLDKTKMSFTIDGPTSATNTACSIVSITKDANDLYTATCITAASAATTGAFFPGGHGWQVDKYHGVDDYTKKAEATSTQKYLTFNAEMSYLAQESLGTTKFVS